MSVLSAAVTHDPGASTIAFLWWALAAVLGAVLGARAETSRAIARLLAGARSANTVPEQRPGLIMLARLWPLLIMTLVAGVLGVLAPQVPGIAAGFAIISALAWRKQYAAVLAVERRDGVRFYVDRSSPRRPISLTRTPGFKVYLPTP
ncbi:MAG: hypothetical protein ABSG64_02230 [Solirubrobacteraceae bacterium]